MFKPKKLPAGSFSSWLELTRCALINKNGTEVPCGDCTACCTSNYFIHVGPDETATLARIPKELLFPAPGLPKGNFVMGYDEQGHCPMLIDNKCSIYEDRPFICRNYDCRIFSAAGINAGDDEKILINQRVQQWIFSFPTKDALSRQAAVKSAVIFLKKHAKYFPDGFVPTNATQLAILAIKVYEIFLDFQEKSIQTGQENHHKSIAEAIIEANRKFELLCYSGVK